jgi:hypothetical protein
VHAPLGALAAWDSIGSTKLGTTVVGEDGRPVARTAVPQPSKTNPISITVQACPLLIVLSFFTYGPVKAEMTGLSC